jgi:hypothetical protein
MGIQTKYSQTYSYRELTETKDSRYQIQMYQKQICLPLLTDVSKIQLCCPYFEHFVRKIYLTSAKFATDNINLNTADFSLLCIMQDMRINYCHWQHGHQALGLLFVLWRLRLAICSVLGNSVNFVNNLLDTSVSTGFPLFESHMFINVLLNKVLSNSDLFN